MNISLGMRAAAVAAVAALGLAACGSNNSAGTSAAAGSPVADGSTSSCRSGTVTAQGSTFQQTLEEQLTSQFASQCAGAKITYSGTGSAAGIQQFTAGKADFAGSDVTMTAQEQQQANSACGSAAMTLPITSGGVAILYNLPGVRGLKLDAAALAGIFEGHITRWNDPAIAAANPGTTLPGTAIKSFHRADGSGTTAVLSGFLNAAAPTVWKLGVNKQITFPSGQGATGSAGVTQGVKSSVGGITYAEVSYAEQDNLPTAEVKGTNSGYQSISSSTVTRSIDSGFTVTGSGADLAGSLAFNKMTGYPIATVSYVLVCSKYRDPAKGALIKDYLTYAAGSGQQQADALGFAPLPSDLQSKVEASVATIS